MNITEKFTDLRSPYESFGAIPEHRRLSNYEEEFKNTDIWAAYFESQYNPETHSESYIRDIDRVENWWKTFCEDHNTHHALATPNLVNEWCKQLLENMTEYSAKINYFVRLNKFYRYLVWNIDYPHWYNPIQYAVCEYREAETIWTAVPSGDTDE
jgi:hypothetical protein